MVMPIRKQILVKPFPSDEISEGGILVPESARQVSNKVKIVKTGGMVKKIKEGCTGYRVKGWGCPVMVDNELHFIMDEDAILAIE